MSEQTKTATPTKAEDAGREERTSAALKAKGEEIDAKIDAVLDSIDGVLEENAAEFVENYVQRGGE